MGDRYVLGFLPVYDTWVTHLDDRSPTTRVYDMGHTRVYDTGHSCVQQQVTHDTQVTHADDTQVKHVDNTQVTHVYDTQVTHVYTQCKETTYIRVPVTVQRMMETQ